MAYHGMANGSTSAKCRCFQGFWLLGNSLEEAPDHPISAPWADPPVASFRRRWAINFGHHESSGLGRFLIYDFCILFDVV